jgi:N-acetylglucosaminyldiphosphoundecaprenol N-acetyl-beta-D-mannosaminyltransferase
MGLRDVSLLGVRVTGVAKIDLITLVEEWAAQPTLRTLVYVNAHCLNTASDDTSYRNILNQADLAYPDGIGVVWASRWLWGVRFEKLTGRDWLPEICKLAVLHNWGIYLLAGRLGIASQAADILKSRFPGIKILGTADGFFSERSEEEVLRELEILQPHILFVGMGTPAQEKWIASHRTMIHSPVVWAVGALFDMVVGIEPPVPNWLNALALEWLWRLVVDPRKKWRRYLIGNPRFVMRVLRQKYMHG